MRGAAPRTGAAPRLDRAGAALSASALVLAAACLSTAGPGPDSPPSNRLRSRPGNVEAAAAPTDEPKRLELAPGRDGLLFVPRGAFPAPPAGVPLLLALHGAGGSGEAILRRIRPHAERIGAIVVAPDSRSRTWGAVRGAPGPDNDFVDRALARTFAAYPVDPRRVAVAGFSDGATCALTLALSNGDLFAAVAAFSPGFLWLSEPPVGRPRIFLSHGTRDEILPIDGTSRSIAATLRRSGYDVSFRTFEGGHSVPPDVLEAGVSFLFPPPSSPSGWRGEDGGTRMAR